MTAPREIRRLDELERRIEPQTDLWPVIAASIAAEAKSATPRRIAVASPRRAIAPWLPWTVAAGIAFIATGVWWTQRDGAELDPAIAALTDPALETERRRLAAEMPALLEGLPVEARLGATQSLDAVRGARRQIVAALRRDASDPALRQWLRDNQQQEVRVMQVIVDVGTQTRQL